MDVTSHYGFKNQALRYPIKQVGDTKVERIAV